ncbi:hypothetical protein E1100_26405 [Vibrio owensii]|uniref:hypothetical protein n=1 Tax=Vibrio owensii TaxID=696485 RepID=UPI001043D3AC|nr:hypothetical protein [Vibrio owensii]TDE19109.1 hypothetical protein E1100_26405 [Vibrio owensii]
MSDIENQKLLKELGEVKGEVKQVARNTKWMAFVSMAIGIFLAYLFNHLSTSSHFVAAIGLYSQIIAFGAAILLSSQFMDIPEKLFGVHSYAIAMVMSLPIYIWLSSVVYAVVSILFGFPRSEVWELVITIPCWGLGLVMFGLGSIQDAIRFDVSDQSLVVALGWYMVMFSLGLQVYLSLISLEVVKVPFS